MKWALVILVLLVVAGLGWIRLAPSDAARWHVAPSGDADRSFDNGVLRVVETGPDGLARLNEAALATPRTRVLAGSVASDMVTYVTRSRVFGFPDYTTVQQDGGVLKLFARSRFGRSDFGVNAQRAELWLAAIKAR